MNQRTEATGLARQEIAPGSARPATDSVLQAIPNLERTDHAEHPDRAERLPSLLGYEGDAARVFSQLKVAVIGTGSVGRPLALHLARLMIHTLWLVDPGRFKATSLLTQPVLPEEIGLAKARSTAQICKRISPDTRVWAADCRGEDLPVLALADADLVLLATDNLAVEVAVGQRCLHLGIPLLQASVHGASLLAQTRFFTNREGHGPCPACAYGEQEWDALNRQTRFSCEKGQAAGGTGRRGAALVQSPPTASFSFLCTLAASLALTQLLRHVLQLGADTGDCLTEYGGYRHRSIVSPLSRNPDCRCEHVVWQQRTAPHALGDCSVWELVRAAGLAEEKRPDQVAVTVDAWEFVHSGRCDGCGRRQPVGRFHDSGQAAAACRDCGQTVTALPFFSQRQVSLAVLAALADQPLRRLTPAPPGWVVIQAGDRGVCFRQRHVTPAGAPERNRS